MRTLICSTQATDWATLEAGAGASYRFGQTPALTQETATRAAATRRLAIKLNLAVHPGFQSSCWPHACNNAALQCCAALPHETSALLPLQRPPAAATSCRQ